MLGLLQSTLSLARCAGPIFAGYVLLDGINIILGVLVAFVAAMIILVVIAYALFDRVHPVMTDHKELSRSLLEDDENM